MRSSSGAHFLALDHVRALAALMVFTWHFIHAATGYPVPFEGSPTVFPLALLDEGHTGVALFMTLSGYLFAKLLDGREISYRAFLWNRSLRIFPLLLVVILIDGVEKYLQGESIAAYAISVLSGVWLPTLPNGGWSITVEFQYYAVLPVFLWLLKKSKYLPFSIVALALFLRFVLHHERGEVQSLAYWTLIGRVDQFALGMLAYQFRAQIAHRHWFALLVMVGFSIFYWFFDLRGGFYQTPSYPSPSAAWIYLSTVEGLAYSVLIAWYESSFAHPTHAVSRFLGKIGEYSYSIYLLHFFVVFHAAKFVNENVMHISNFYLAVLWSAVCFLLMMPIGYLSFHLIEAPFLKLRRRYTISTSL